MWRGSGLFAPLISHDEIFQNKIRMKSFRITECSIFFNLIILVEQPHYHRTTNQKVKKNNTQVDVGQLGFWVWDRTLSNPSPLLSSPPLSTPPFSFPPLSVPGSHFASGQRWVLSREDSQCTVGTWGDFNISLIIKHWEQEDNEYQNKSLTQLIPTWTMPECPDKLVLRSQCVECSQWTDRTFVVSV